MRSVVCCVFICGRNPFDSKEGRKERKGKTMKAIISICGVALLLAVQAQGQLFSSNGTGGGDWNDGATWVGGLAPGAAGDRGEINAGDTVTATADMDDVPIRIIEEFAGSAEAGTLNVGPGGTVNWYGGTSIIQSDANINAPIRIGNHGNASAHIIFKGDAILTADKELWSDSEDTRFFAQENAQMIIGSAGGAVAMGASAPGTFSGLYVFGNGQLDLSHGRFWADTYNRAILLQNADVGATVHVNSLFDRDEVYQRFCRFVGVGLVRHEFLPVPEYRKLVARMDAGLQCTFAETFNYAAAEHMMLRVPALGSRLTPCMQFEDLELREALWVDNVCDVMEMADKLQALKDRDVRQRLGEKCREHICAVAERRSAIAGEVLERLLAEG